jgi:osmotically-inducible protein OsmY
MWSDSDIERELKNRLQSDPDTNDADIATSIKDGIITLSGFVRSVRQRRKAEMLARNIVGVAGLANNLQLRLPLLQRRPDPEIARDALESINRRLPYSGDRIRVVVEDGLISLEGQIEWAYQNEAAEYVAEAVGGARCVVNKLDVCSYVSPNDIMHKVGQALLEAASFDANSRSSESVPNEIVLLGAIRSWVDNDATRRSR